jgi:hypothetical protein
MISSQSYFFKLLFLEDFSKGEDRYHRRIHPAG